MVSRIVLAACVLVTVVSNTVAKTWIVASDGSGDFTDIYMAVGAAVDGDVIIVRPGSYNRFTILGKSLVVIGSGTGVTVVHYLADGSSTVGIGNMAGKRALVGHLSLHGDLPLAADATGGVVGLSDIELLRDYGPARGTNTGFYSKGGSTFFVRCPLKDLIPPDIDTPVGSPPGALLNGGTVAICQSFLDGHEGTYAANGQQASPGGAGILASSAEVYLAELSTLGGLGGKAFIGGLYCDEVYYAERGGHGLELITNTHLLTATRDPAMFFQGGKGGYGGPLPGCGNPSFPGGPGGDCVHADPTSFAVLSGPYQLFPGVGGDGNPVGPPGSDKVGSVFVENKPLPTLTIGGTGAIGAQLSLQIHGDPGDRVHLLLSDNFAKTVMPGLDGFPLFASPGGSYFFAFSLGTLSASDLDLTFTLPDDQSLIGKLVLFQAVVISQDPTLRPRLTNVTAEILRDH
ncbi:MAG: hypothetical protein U1E76_07950 [Planctomycetota bacterium]